MSKETAELQIAGQKAKITGDKVTLFFTIAIAIGVGVLIWVSWMHQQDQREANKEFVTAVKDQTAAMKEATVVQRESNCLQSQKDPEFCRRISR